MNSIKKFDLIKDLPTDNNNPSEIDVEIVNTLFKKKDKKSLKNKKEEVDEEMEEECENVKENFLIKNLKKIMPYVILVFIITLFYFIPTTSISKFLPSIIKNSEYALVLVKSILIAIMYYMFINFGPKF